MTKYGHHCNSSIRGGLHPNRQIGLEVVRTEDVTPGKVVCLGAVKASLRQWLFRVNDAKPSRHQSENGRSGKVESMQSAEKRVRDVIVGVTG